MTNSALLCPHNQPHTQSKRKKLVANPMNFPCESCQPKANHIDLPTQKKENISNHFNVIVVRGNVVPVMIKVNFATPELSSL
jgi:hypothetical protein